MTHRLPLLFALIAALTLAAPAAAPAAKRSVALKTAASKVV